MAVTLPETTSPNLTQYYTDPALEKARTAAETAGTTAAQYTSAGSLLPYKLKDAILQKLNYNADIINQQSKSQANYFNTPAQARLQYQNVWDPQQREALVSTAKTQAYQPYSALTDILNTRMGSVSDIIGAGSAALKGEETMANATADRLNKAYNDLVQRATLLSNATQSQTATANEQAWLKYNALTAAQNFIETMAQNQKNRENQLAIAKLGGNYANTLIGLSGGSSGGSSGGILNPNDANSIKAMFPGYVGWNDSAAIVADFRATGGQGKA